MMDRGLKRRVMLFQPSWSGVDELRDRIAAQGLADRVSVHHVDALAWLPEDIQASVVRHLGQDAATLSRQGAAMLQ